MTIEMYSLLIIVVAIAMIGIDKWYWKRKNK